MEMNGTDNKRKRINADIEHRKSAGASCSEATLLGIFDNLESPLGEDALKAVAAGFRGGIGGTHDEGTCGALSAGVIALGLLYPNDGKAAAAASKELYNHFKQQQGAVACARIMGSNGKKNCLGCCLCAGDKVAEIVRRKEKP